MPMSSAVTRSSASNPTRQQLHGSARAPTSGFAAARPIVIGLARLAALPLVSAAPLSIFGDGLRRKAEDAPKDAEDPSLWIYLSVAIFLVLLGGAFAGLTIALMGQDETYLQVIATSGDGPEQHHAHRVLKLLKKGKHWVLVTLLLSNVITNETLPIVLDRSLGGGWPAVVSSTVLIVIFGEIVPQSICVRYGLSIGAYMAPCVLVLMYIMFPVAWPTAKLLDYLLGEDHGTMYKKAGLKTLVQLHKTLGTTPAERLMEDEVTIINSVLDLKDKPVGDIMTPMADVFTMSADTVLDERMMDTILSQGYSRIPVYAPDDTRNFIGMLLVKILITYDPEDCKRVRDFALATLPETSPYTSCLDIINFFQEGKSHMVLVSDFPGQAKGALGVVTLEDVIEELIGEEIIDESDVFVDVHKAIRRLQPAPRYRFRHQEGDTAASESEFDPKEPSEDEPLLGHTNSIRTPSVPPAKGTLIARRKSSTASDSAREAPESITVRNTPSDLRKHLSHLGPGNPASRPRATKYSSVKIKPGVDTIPEGQIDSKATQPPPPKDSPQSPIITPQPSSNQESSALLPPAGKIASDGVAAVQAGYGATDSSPRRISNEQMSASEASRIARENTDIHTSPRSGKDNSSVNGNLSPHYKPQNSSRLVVGTEAGDTVGEMEGPPSRHRSKSRQKARSGSITQTEVEGSGGMKKIVLDISSSSEEQEDGASGKSTSPRHSPTAGEDDVQSDHGIDGTQSNGSKKRTKKRGKKKKRGPQ